MQPYLFPQDTQLCLCCRSTERHAPETLQVLHRVSSAGSQTEEERRQAVSGR